MQQQRALIIGGGGVGVLVGFNLEASKRIAATFILRSNYTSVLTNGFNLNSCDHGQHSNWIPTGSVLKTVPHVSDDTASQDAKFDWVICATKNTPDVGTSLEDVIRPAITPGYTTIVLIQNGLGIEKSILAAFPQNIVLSGVSYCGVQELSPGHILHSEHDKLVISAFTNPSLSLDLQQQRAQEFVDIYSISGKTTAIFEKDVAAIRWKKLLVNAVYNPACALTDLDTSRLRLVAPTGPQNIVDTFIKPAMCEVQCAAREVDSVVLSDADIEAAVHADPIDAFSVPSMQQDVRKGRYAEHEVILGNMLRAGTERGVAMPICATLYQLCRAVQFRTMERNGLVDVRDLAKSAASM